MSDVTIKKEIIKREIIKKEKGLSKEERAKIKRLEKRKRQKRNKAAQKKANWERKKRLEEARIKKAKNKTDEVEIEWISDRSIEYEENAVHYIKAFSKFQSVEAMLMDPKQLAALEEEEKKPKVEEIKAKMEDEDKKLAEEKKEEEVMSKKKRKKLRRLKIAELKRLVDQPDIVEEHDPNSADPRLLIFLKSVRNTIPVPVHWSQKRKYLQGKRGYEKRPFELPTFIAATGITQIREKQLQLGVERSMKQKARSKMRPKRGGLGIDYQVLHDAFFRHMTKPKNMSKYGELYFEGKEFEQKFKKFKPGYISDRLKRALNMQCRYRVVAQQGVAVQSLSDEGEWQDVTVLQYNTLVDWEDDNKDKDRIKVSHPAKGWILKYHKQTKQPLIQRLNVDSPPPWLISMQRFGPPPAYPEVLIPGLNAPIPPWCKYGFADGQWGKPPVGRNGRPLYGNPFGVWQPEELIQANQYEVPHWGAVEEVESEEEEESSEDEEDDQITTITGSGTTDPDSSTLTGVASATSFGPGTSSITSLSGLDIAEEINLRKKGIGTETPESTLATKQLYKVLEKQEHDAKQGIFGSSHTYKGLKTGSKKQDVGGVHLAINPEDIGNLDEKTIKRKFEEQQRLVEDEPSTKKGRRGEYDVRF